MSTFNRHQTALVPLHDELVSEAWRALHHAIARLDAPRVDPRTRHIGCRQTAELVSVALELLHRAETTIAVSGRPPAAEARRSGR